jgi:hypothetical protein
MKSHLCRELLEQVNNEPKDAAEAANKDAK